MKPINSAAFNETVRHGRKNACLILSMVILAAVALSPQAVGGSITYEFQNYPTARVAMNFQGQSPRME